MTEQIRARVLDPATVDEAVRPQDDFYRHVNGTWIATHEIPADRPIDGAFHALRDLSEERGRAIAEDAAAGRLDDVDADLLARLWTGFMDEEAVESAGITPLSAALARIDEAAAAGRGALDRLSGEFMAAGVGSFFGVYVGTHPHDSNRRILTVVQSGIGLPDESYYREDQYAPIRQAYVAHLSRLVALSSLSSDSAAAASSLMALETGFAAHHRDSVSNRNPLLSDNQVPWADFVASNPGFDWRGWAEGVGLDLADDAVVNVDQPDFIHEAAALWGATPIENLVLWLKTSLVDANAGLLSTPFVDENFDFFGRTLSGTQELRPRWKRALGLIESVAGESLGRVWVARHFPPASKERMDALVAGLLRAYGEAIRASEWMGEETKKRALDKLATFRPKIGYPPKWRDMSGLELPEGASLVDLVSAARAFEARREFAKLPEPVDRDEWLMTPQTVNAYYNPPLNEIVFPAAILQPPFFDPEADDAVNFGAIGAVIGHEIGHGFDDQGSRFDADGNLENWWEDADRERFEALTNRLIAQYDALTPKDLEGEDAPHVNGALTVGENIGDLGGLSIAWAAWANALAENGLTPETAPEIDGLTGPQRFFSSWARAWRTASRTEFARQMLAVDPHSPAEFRCNQILRNIDAFHAAYGVHEGDAMFLPKGERVRIW
ncbi:M13 family metallopeptidase [Actinomyces culturomici]|uniref:M13 family metallopeptidase n=1 Tax=Actinomyces culturomici TaxID=1926276 RepID=UPI000E203B8B|nr:M13-type metalloendopeptidase [Actinomyces culturomici]